MSALSHSTRNKMLSRLKKSANNNVSPISIDPQQRNQPFPMTDMQQAYWLGRSSSLKGGDVAMHLYLEFSGNLIDRARLQQALQTVIARHDMLRAVVIDSERQRVLPEVPQLEVEYRDWRLLGFAEQQSVLAEVRADMSHRKSDLTQWPQNQVLLSQTADNAMSLHLSLDLWCIDGRSYQILLKELAHCYQHQGEAGLPEVKLTFRDYVLYRQSEKDSPAMKKAQAYWKPRLEALPSAPSLPVNKQPQEQVNFTRLLTKLSPEQTQRLDNMARRYSVTTTCVLLTVYSKVLAKWSGEDHFTLNIPRFNRPNLHPDINHVIGEFATFSLLEVNLDNQQSFIDQVRGIQQQLLADIDHASMTGVELNRQLTQLRGSVMNMPIVFTAAPELGQEQQALEDQIAVFGDVVQAITQTPQVQLDCQYYRMGGGLNVNWDAQEGVFEPGVISDMFATFEHCLNQLCAEYSDWQEPVAIALPEGHQQVWNTLNQTEREYELVQWSQHLAKLAEQQPDAQALVCGQQTINWQQFYTQASKRAAWLQQQPLAEGVVALWMDKGIEQVMMAMAIVLSGRAYLPLDTEAPTERIALILQEAQAVALISDRQCTANVEGCRIISAVDLGEQAGKVSQPYHPVTYLSEQLAYVIYTSGSTGKPKGVPVKHHGLSNVVDFNLRHFELSRQDKVMALSAIHHDMSIFDLFSGLAAGACLVIPSELQRRQPDAWLDLACEHQVSVWNSVPAAAELLFARAERVGNTLPALRLMTLGGDWVRHHMQQQVSRWAPNCRLHSVGGPTEISLWNITASAEGDFRDWQSLPYGSPIQNSQYFILGADNELCPLWVSGEMVCRGAGVFAGYLNRPELTADCLFEHPKYGTLYRSGDIGRLRPCGKIEFIGRKDNRVKVNGHRIELGELEQLACQLPGISQAVALLVEIEGSVKLGLTYQVSEQAGEQVELRLKQHLSSLLPAALLPQLWLAVSQWPLTENNKIDRRVLRRDLAVADLDEQPVTGALQQVIAELWQTLLGQPIERANDNFFLKGADSITATQLIGQIEQRLGISLSIADIFIHPTVSQQAELVGKQLLQFAQSQEVSES